MYNLAAERTCPACFDSVRLLTNIVFSHVEQICQVGPRLLLHISNPARQMRRFPNNNGFTSHMQIARRKHLAERVIG